MRRFSQTNKNHQTLAATFKQQFLKRAIEDRERRYSAPNLAAPVIPQIKPPVARTQFMYNNTTKVVHIRPQQGASANRVISSGPLQPLEQILKPLQPMVSMAKVIHKKPGESQPRILDVKLNLISGPKQVMEEIQQKKQVTENKPSRQQKPKSKSKTLKDLKKKQLLFQKPLYMNQPMNTNPLATKKFQPKVTDKKNSRNDEQGWRMGRAKRHMIHLIQAEEFGLRDWRISIRGNQGRVYEVIIKDKLSCTCPDFVNNQKPCKHLFFVIISIADSKKLVEGTAGSIKLDEEKLKIICMNLKEKVKRLIHRAEQVDLAQQIKLSAKQRKCLICFKRLGKPQYVETCSKCRTKAHRQCLRAYFSQTSLCPVCKIKFQNLVQEVPEPPKEPKAPKQQKGKKSKSPVPKAPKPPRSKKAQPPKPSNPVPAVIKEPTMKIPSKKTFKQPQVVKPFEQEQQQFDPLTFLNNHSDSEA